MSDTEDGGADVANGGRPAAPTRRRKAKGGGLGPTIGGILVGFDQEIMRRLPPAQELVRRGTPVRRVAGQDGSDLVIGLPEDLASDDAPDEEGA